MVGEAVCLATSAVGNKPITIAVTAAAAPVQPPIMPVRPDLQTRYDAEIAQLQSTMAAGKDPAHVTAALAPAQRAADVFAGSRDADEMELRHIAFLHAAGTLRSTGMLTEAEAAFQKAAEVARTEIGRESREHWISYYFIGLV